jgi:hypothetical protein
MNPSRLRLMLFVFVGVLLLLTPMSVFHGDLVSQADRKLVALRYFAVSMTGLALIVLALVAQYFKRRARRIEDTQA